MKVFYIQLQKLVRIRVRIQCLNVEIVKDIIYTTQKKMYRTIGNGGGNWHRHRSDVTLNNDPYLLRRSTISRGRKKGQKTNRFPNRLISNRARAKRTTDRTNATPTTRNAASNWRNQLAIHAEHDYNGHVCTTYIKLLNIGGDSAKCVFAKTFKPRWLRKIWLMLGSEWIFLLLFIHFYTFPFFFCYFFGCPNCFCFNYKQLESIGDNFKDTVDKN